MKMHQIYEDDLQKLEYALPQVFGALSPDLKNDARFQVLLEECKEVLSSVRWNYGPHTNVQRVNGENDG
jgi:hypothetical protein